MGISICPGNRSAVDTPRNTLSAARAGHPLLPARAGLGLKSQHLHEVLSERPDVGFWEVHAENYMVAGGPAHRGLKAIREHYPLSLHGVGLSIGTEGPLDTDHLHRLRALIQRYEPAVFSEHLAWSSHGGNFFNDLLPVPYDKNTLDRVCAHVDLVQSRLARRILIENPSTYVEFVRSTMSETQFLTELVARTGCGLLLDVNNAYVSAVNHGRNPQAYIDEFPLEAVGEIHLAGFTEDVDAAGDRLLIDTHSSNIDREVWSLYAYALSALGRPIATLIERDGNVPPLCALLAEAQQADAVLRSVNTDDLRVSA